MKNTYKIILAASVLCGFLSCTKYGNDIDLEQNVAKQGILNSDIQKRLADAPFGWLVYVPNLDTTIKSAVPLLLQFDTLKGTISSKSPFPASSSAVPSLYDLSSATGAPLLSFATGSIISGWYEAGGITDFYFKILSLEADTITMQPYRKGNVYASEGGVVMKMIRQKAPFVLYDNPVNVAGALTENAAPFYNSATNPIRLNNVSGYVHPAINMEFDRQSAGNLTFFRTYVPFAKYLGMTPIFLFVNSDYVNPIIYYCGNNTLFTHVDNGFTPAAWFTTGPRSITNALKTDYLLVRSINAARTKIELYALDVTGKEIITGTLEVK